MGEALEAFHDYAADFGRLDARAVATHFHQPAMLVGPPGVSIFASHADVEAFYGKVMGDLRTRGYVRTDFGELREQRLDDGLAVVSGPGVWRAADGRALGDRFAMSYTFRRTGEGWRVLVAVIHRP